MTDSTPVPVAPQAWRRPVYLLLVAVALALVLFAWLRTPEVQVETQSEESGYRTVQCANAGPSPWEPPVVWQSQEIERDALSIPFNQALLKSDLESIRVDLACTQARDGQTKTLIVVTFAAGAILFFGHSSLWMRRAAGKRPSQLT